MPTPTDLACFGRTSLGIQSPLSEEPRVPVGHLVDISTTSESIAVKPIVAALTASNLATHDIRQHAAVPMDKITLANVTSEHVKTKPVPPPAANKPTLLAALSSSEAEGCQGILLASPDDYTEFTDFDSSEWDESEISSTPSELQSLYGNVGNIEILAGRMRKSDMATELRAQLLARQQNPGNKKYNECKSGVKNSELYVNECINVDVSGDKTNPTQQLSQPVSSIGAVGSDKPVNTSLNMQQTRAELEKIIINSTSNTSNISHGLTYSRKLNNEAPNQNESRVVGLADQLINPCKRRYVNVEVSQSGYPLYFVLECIKKGIEWELNLERGETVEVIERINSDWLYVKAMSGEEGWAPTSFLSPLAPEGREMEGKSCRSEQSTDNVKGSLCGLTIKPHEDMIQGAIGDGMDLEEVHTCSPFHTGHTLTVDIHMSDTHNPENAESSKSARERAAVIFSGSPKTLHGVQHKDIRPDVKPSRNGKKSSNLENELKAVQLKPVGKTPNILPLKPPIQNVPTRKTTVTNKKTCLTVKPKLPTKPKLNPGTKPPATIPGEENESVNVLRLSKMFENNH